MAIVRRGVPLPLLWSPYGDSEICGVTNEAGFNALRTYVHERTDLCSFSGATDRLLEHPDNSNIKGKTRMKYNFIMFK